VSDRYRVLYLAIGVQGGLIVVALVLGNLLEQPPLERLRLVLRDVGWGLVATLPMLVGFFLAVRWPIGPLRSIQSFTDRVLLPMLAPCTNVDLLGISCLAGLGEEMLFRGVIQDRLGHYMPAGTALVVSAVLFGVMHGVTITYALMAMVAGLYLGWLFSFTDNLLVPVIAHTLYDFVALFYLLRLRDIPEDEAAIEETPEDSDEESPDDEAS